jgi:hypothetical protein
MHFFSDCYALSTHRRPVGVGDLAVDSLLFTALLPSAAKILLNVECGDYGEVEQRSCGCSLETAGLTTHLSQVRSFEKLTSEGISFTQTNLAPILEKVLPSRFGGTAADYQLVEEEGQHGIARLLMVVSPRVGSVNEDQLRQTFLEELGRDGALEKMNAKMWQRVGTLEVSRQEPIATAAGKVLPFYLLRSGQSASNSRTGVGSQS